MDSQKSNKRKLDVETENPIKRIRLDNKEGSFYPDILCDLTFECTDGKIKYPSIMFECEYIQKMLERNKTYEKEEERRTIKVDVKKEIINTIATSFKDYNNLEHRYVNIDYKKDLYNIFKCREIAKEWCLDWLEKKCTVQIIYNEEWKTLLTEEFQKSEPELFEQLLHTHARKIINLEKDERKLLTNDIARKIIKIFNDIANNPHNSLNETNFWNCMEFCHQYGIEFSEIEYFVARFKLSLKEYRKLSEYFDIISVFNYLTSKNFL
jgi:hypothetical protein